MSVVFAVTSLLVVVALPTFSQKTNVFKGRVLLDGAPLALTTISFGSLGTSLTDTQGYFRRSFSTDVRRVKIEKLESYEFISPYNGELIYDSDTVAVDVLLSRGANKKEVAEEIYQKMENLVKGNRNDIKDLEKTLQEFIVASKELYRKQFETVELERMLIQEKERVLREEGKVNYLPIITNSFDHYISRTRDLRDEFRRRGAYVFHDTGTNINEINKRIMGYSEAYEELNKGREEFNLVVEYYWDDRYLRKEIQDLLDKTLDDFHKSQVLKYNLLLNDIDLFNQNRKGHRKKTEIKRDIDEYVEVLTQNIDIIERNKSRVIQQLKDY